MWPALKRLEISIYVSTVKKQGEGGCQRAINLYFHPSEPKPAPFLKGNSKAGSDMFGVALCHTFLYDFNFNYMAKCSRNFISNRTGCVFDKPGYQILEHMVQK